MDTLWVADRDGEPVARPVRAGLTDGSRTAVEGAGIVAGMSVIVGTTEGSAAASTGATTRSPLQPSGQRRGPPGPF